MRVLYAEQELDYDFDLIAVVTPVKSYRLCWLLGKKLEVDFKREDDLRLALMKERISAFFDLYKYSNEIDHTEWIIIQNKSAGTQLMPELKNIDYLFLVKGGGSENPQDILEKIKTIPLIQTAFKADVQKLKSKENLLLV